MNLSQKQISSLYKIYGFEPNHHMIYMKDSMYPDHNFIMIFHFNKKRKYYKTIPPMCIGVYARDNHEQDIHTRHKFLFVVKIFIDDTIGYTIKTEHDFTSHKHYIDNHTIFGFNTTCEHVGQSETRIVKMWNSYKQITPSIPKNVKYHTRRKRLTI